jgi:crotonobetainyl-CoA:carnitine CoA-transferase CaiB-like acyl-CoA transferase
MAAFALASALFQRERTGKGQRIDLAMYDVALMLAASHVTSFLRTGAPPQPNGNNHAHATNCCYETKDGLLMLGASNLRQQRRLWTLLGRPDMAKDDNDQRHDDRAREMAVLADLMRTRTADEWEAFLQQNHVPAGRVRTLAEALADPQVATRDFLHTHRRRGRGGRRDGPGRSVPARPWRRAGDGAAAAHGCRHRRGADRARLRSGRDREAPRGRGDLAEPRDRT